MPATATTQPVPAATRTPQPSTTATVANEPTTTPAPEITSALLDEMLLTAFEQAGTIDLAKFGFDRYRGLEQLTPVRVWRTGKPLDSDGAVKEGESEGESYILYAMNDEDGLIMAAVPVRESAKPAEEWTVLSAILVEYTVVEGQPPLVVLLLSDRFEGNERGRYGPSWLAIRPEETDYLQAVDRLGAALFRVVALNHLSLRQQSSNPNLLLLGEAYQRHGFPRQILKIDGNTYPALLYGIAPGGPLAMILRLMTGFDRGVVGEFALLGEAGDNDLPRE
jgi:hypothetical protein